MTCLRKFLLTALILSFLLTCHCWAQQDDPFRDPEPNKPSVYVPLPDTRTIDEANRIYKTREWAIENASRDLAMFRSDRNTTPRFRDRREFLAWYLNQGPNSIRMMDSSFHYGEKEQLEKDRKYVAALGETLADSKPEEFEIDRTITSMSLVLSPPELASVWFSEIGINGPFHFLNRQDVIAELNITQIQLAEIEKARDKHCQSFETELRKLKRNAIMAVFDELSKTQRQKYQSTAGYRIAALAAYFEDLPTRSFADVLELRKDMIVLKPVEFTGETYDPLLKHLLQSVEINPQSIRPHDEEQRERFKKLYRTINAIPPAATARENISLANLLQRDILAAIEAVGPLLIDSQTDLTLRFEDNVSWHMVLESLDKLGQNLANKLIQCQLATARDAILVRIGPVKFLLTPCVAKESGLSEKEIERLITFSTDQYRTLLVENRKLLSAGFAALFEPLTRTQINQLQQRVGFTLAEMATMYPGILDLMNSGNLTDYPSMISDEQFLKDFAAVK